MHEAAQRPSPNHPIQRSVLEAEALSRRPHPHRSHRRPASEIKQAYRGADNPQSNAHRRPPAYSQKELDHIFAKCDAFEKTAFATLLLIGIREEELYLLTWADADLKDADNASIRVTPKEGSSPKDHEEGTLPIPKELAEMLKKLPQTAPP